MTAAVAAFAEAFLLHVVWYGYEQRLIDRVVSDELRRSVEIHAREPALAYPNTGDLTLFVVSRDGSGDALPAYLRPLVEDPGTADGGLAVRELRGPDGVDYHVGVAPRGDRVFLLEYDAREHDERRTHLLWAVMGIALALTLVARRAATELVDRLLAGLSRLQRRVGDARNAPAFLDEDMDEEVAALAAALDEQRLQVVAALRKERAFAAAASHELRTPLTRIATGAEVLLAQPALPEPLAVRLRSIRASVDELQRLLDVLLAVARWQPGSGQGVTAAPTAPPRALGEVVDGCVARLAAEARLLGATVSVELSSPGRRVDHPAMLEVVVSNLLRNALRHGRGAPVSIHEHDGTLEIVDAGPGIDPSVIDRVFDPFWRGSAESEDTGPSGLGLGLTIVERVCAAAGWRLSIASGDGGGTRATVRLVAEGAEGAR